MKCYVVFLLFWEAVLLEASYASYPLEPDYFGPYYDLTELYKVDGIHYPSYDYYTDENDYQDVFGEHFHPLLTYPGVHSHDYRFPDYIFGYINENEDKQLGLNEKSEAELLSLLHGWSNGHTEDGGHDVNAEDDDDDDEDMLPILHRKKRGVRSRSRSGSSSRSSSGSSSSTSRGSRLGWGSSRRSTPAPYRSRPSTDYGRRVTSAPSYPSPSPKPSGYPTASYPSPSPKPSGYPTASYPSSGGYPTGSYPSPGGYPTGSNTGVGGTLNTPGSYPPAGFSPGNIKPAGGYPTGSNTGVGGTSNTPGSYPPAGFSPGNINPAGGYPTASNTGVGGTSNTPGSYPPAGFSPGNINPAGGYPTASNTGVVGTSNTLGSYPPAGFSPGNINPAGGYPTGSNTGVGGTSNAPGSYPPAGFSLGNIKPVSGYPTGYPTGGSPNPVGPIPPGGYTPGSIKPVAGYPTGSYPPGSYPGSTNPIGPIPSGGYPTGGIKPAGGYPTGSYPSGGYPGGTYPINPSPGYPHSPGTSFPGATHGYPKPKLSKKEKIKEKIKQAITGYATYKMHKKMKKKKGKFLNPSAMGYGGYGGMGGGYGGMGGGYGGMGGGYGGMGGGHGGMGGGYGGMGMGMGATMAGFGGKKKNGKTKLIKKVIGAAIKLTIAKYVLKYGAKAAKAYFEYKLGRKLEDVMLEKFVTRYHRQRTRHFYREHRRVSGASGEDFKMENITLGEDCIRDCVPGEHLTCFFSFNVHLYQTLSRACYDCPNTTTDCGRPDCVVGSGRRKLVTAVNRQIPGPAIEVCHGDKVLLEVQNDLPSTGVTIHFRGQTYNGTPEMEGTPGVTQSPISPGDIFTYIFKADKSGTHFWHANTGVMRSDGVFGPFIVRETLAPHGPLYDVDLTNQTLMVSEDLVKNGEDQLVSMNQRNGKIEVYSLLVNGIGFKLGESPDDIHRSDMTYARLTVLAGKTHRLRIISAVSSNCPFTFRVLGHEPLSIIYIDGSPVNPREAKAILISPGERFDVVLKAVPTGFKWIEIKGMLDCQNQTQYAVLHSKERLNELAIPMFNATEPVQDEDITLPSDNPRLPDSGHTEINETAVYCKNSEVTCPRNLTSTTPLPETMSEANITLYLALTKRKIHNEQLYSLLHYDIASMPLEEQFYTWQINNLTLKLPPNPLLVDDSALKNSVCSEAGVLRQLCVESFCECLHLLELPLGAVVDIVLVNEGPVSDSTAQTLYFHGHTSWLVAQGNEFTFSNESLDNDTSFDHVDRLRVIVKDAEELLPRNHVNPISVNSVTVPEAGYAVMRFQADNPGYWLMESSSVFKSATGMGIVVRIGDENDILKLGTKKRRC